MCGYGEDRDRIGGRWWADGGLVPAARKGDPAVGFGAYRGQVRRNVGNPHINDRLMFWLVQRDAVQVLRTSHSP